MKSIIAVENFWPVKVLLSDESESIFVKASFVIWYSSPV